MAELEKVLKRVRVAADRLAEAEAETSAARADLYEQLRSAQAVRATWDEMMKAGSVSRVTLAKALRDGRS
jgi:transcriptional regulator of nitric oxide reductase